MNGVINYIPPAYPIYSFPPELAKAIYEVMEKVKLTARSIGFLESEVDAWIAARAEMRNAA
ncbi:helix-turn-helix transcriptional regulator [Burkholderia pyrrocinia]|uniref:helix-turn-helix transcriptional regulator n=1 Tax=Burkholderia pyrrocinia TaxID=60550 RepID=UPI00158A6A65|nr:AlpA family phage regulatory protein [Burkholderia pyrrocinia]